MDDHAPIPTALETEFCRLARLVERRSKAGEPFRVDLHREGTYSWGCRIEWGLESSYSSAPLVVLRGRAASLEEALDEALGGERAVLADEEGRSS